ALFSGAVGARAVDASCGERGKDSSAGHSMRAFFHLVNVSSRTPERLRRWVLSYMERFLRTIVVPVIAVAVGVLVGMLFLWSSGYPAISTFKNIVRESFHDWYGFGQVLRATTLLTFTGLA